MCTGPKVNSKASWSQAVSWMPEIGQNLGDQGEIMGHLGARCLGPNLDPAFGHEWFLEAILYQSLLQASYSEFALKWHVIL